ncbi:CopG family ribbon-helix-helix protein [Agrobacterium larrymoorei]|uniref:Ribbon-helix-helix protein, CopG family n=1 Tax=Agrobacterium larrymoorei TaxID=160699 RepID=A0A4D7DRJ5_9HYPH|nr:ribbon-helix-helix protein, CopG family [Agrobacterium larrymoorei]QCI96909.1 ribbon-helix-helix protein, CopG family [Agrobacterium larrymoorei]QYA07664.1 ribbon-helix-helix protein, CopG family [Agrobacterium larrymoorei]
MKSTIQLPDDIDRRIDYVAAQTNLTRSQIVEEALSFGRSLAWQEQWIAGVKAGIADADKGDFASEDEIAAVLGRYDQV